MLCQCDEGTAHQGVDGFKSGAHRWRVLRDHKRVGYRPLSRQNGLVSTTHSTSYSRESTVYLLSEPFALRERADDDQPFLLELYLSTRDDLQQAIPDLALLQQLIAMQFNAQETGYRHQFPLARQLVLLRSGHPIGRMVVDASPEQLRLVDIAIAPPARRSGAAMAALAALQRHAAAQGLPLCLAVGRYNGPAQCLYQKCGFTSVTEDDLFVQMIWRSASL